MINIDGAQDIVLQNMAPWYIEYFKLKGIWEMADSGRTFWPSPESGDKILIWEMPSLIPRGKMPSLIYRGDEGMKGIWTNEAC